MIILPDFARTDRFKMSITLHGQVQDWDFQRYLEEVAPANLAFFSICCSVLSDSSTRQKAATPKFAKVMDSALTNPTSPNVLVRRRLSQARCRTTPNAECNDPNAERPD